VHVETNELMTLKLPEETSIAESFSSSSINDPGKNKQWMADRFDLEKFHKNLPSTASAQTKKHKTLIAILDTGVDAAHEDLKDNFSSISPKSDTDQRGHGTHCAGIAAAVTGNKIGIASWIPAGIDIKVTSVQVMNSRGMGTQKMIIDGIIKAADNGADVISMSLGGRSNSKRQKAYEEAVKYAQSKGCIVVVAAGNSSRDARDYTPANVEGVISVAAIDTMMLRANFSNDVSNLKMGIAAPGTKIYSTMPGDTYAANSGTSMAAPFVSGLIGLMKFYKPSLTTEEAYKILKQTAQKKKDEYIVDPNKAFDEFFKGMES